MDGYLITDKSRRDPQKGSKYIVTGNGSSSFEGRLASFALLAFAGFLSLLPDTWGITLIPETSMFILSLSGCLMGIWLCHLKNEFKEQDKRCLNGICFDSQAVFWFTVGLFLTRPHGLEISILLIAVASLVNELLLDDHYPTGKFDGLLFSLIILILLMTSLLNNLSIQLMMSIGMAIFANAQAQKSKSSCHYVKHLLSSIKTTALTSLITTRPTEISRFISNIPIGIVKWNSKRQLVSINPAAARIFQSESECLMGAYIDQLITSRHIVLIPQTDFDQLFYKTMPNNSAQQDLMSQAQVICKWHETDRYDRNGKICGGMACLENVTEQVKMILKIKHHAYFDLLTGLPNRYRLAEEMARVLSAVQRTNSYCALLFIDLDRFKEVNDQWGHNHGDAVLEAFAQRLRKIIRSEETVARLGGDEFVAVVEGLGTCKDQAKNHVTHIAAKILGTTKNDFIIGNKVSQIGCSIGITLFNDASLNSRDLLGRADHALYRIKRSGRCDYMFDEITTLPKSEIPLRELQFQH